MQQFYCEGWFRADKRATGSWTEDQARRRHADGAPYVVLVGSVERPFCFMEVTRNFIGVGFLDNELRERLSYAFQRVEDGRLFLSMATYRDFIGDADRVAGGTSYIFSEAGSVSIRRETFDPHRAETADVTCDVRGNYEAAPGFGRYGDLIKVERPFPKGEKND